MKSLSKTLLSSLLLTAAALGAGSAQATIQYLGVGSIPAVGTDLSGLTNILEDGSTPNNIIGMGSGIAYAGGNTFIGVPDRGPNANPYIGGTPVDNTQSFQSRFQEVTLGITKSGSDWIVTPTLAKTTVLTNLGGEKLTGLSSDFTHRFDPEGVQLSNSTKSVFISDEYGPFIREFDRATGKQIREIAVPAKFLVAMQSGMGADELPDIDGNGVGNTSGRQANRGMEGLAISPDGKTLYGIMQNALIQDGALNGSNSRRGVNNRILKVDLETGQTQEFVFQLDNRSNGVNDIVAVNDHEFLLVERDGNAGASAAVKKIFKIDISGATDVSGVTLPQTGLPAGVSAVGKQLFLDLLDPAFGLAGASFPEKIEGITFGYDVFDGANWLHTLVVTNDNDFVPGQPLNFYVFGFTDADLAGFDPQHLPEPGALALFGLGLAGLIAGRRRK